MKKIIPLLILLLIACQSNTAPEDIPEYTVENYFPLEIGNTWNWINKAFIELDTFVLYEIKIDSSYIWNGKTVYETITTYWQRTRQTFVIECTPYYNYYDGGIYEWECEKPSNDGSYFLRIKEPLETGNEWGRSSDADDQRLEITEIGISRSVEAGNFDDCIKVELVGSEKYWIYAPNVGLIETDAKELWDYEVE